MPRDPCETVYRGKNKNLHHWIITQNCPVSRHCATAVVVVHGQGAGLALNAQYLIISHTDRDYQGYFSENENPLRVQLLVLHMCLVRPPT